MSTYKLALGITQLANHTCSEKYFKFWQKSFFTAMETRSYNSTSKYINKILSTQEDEAELQVPGQAGLHSETLSQKQIKKLLKM
jgi:hypothetical protein